MKTKTATIETGEENLLGKNPADMLALVKAIGIGILSFLFGSAQLFGAISPFGAAFVASLPIRYAITAAIGSSISVFVFGRSGYTAFYITALLFTAGIRFCLARLVKHRIKPAFSGLIGFGAMAVSAVLYNLLNKVGLVDFMLMSIEVILCGCFAYFFAISGDALLRKRSNPILSYVQLTSIAVLFIAAICGFAGYSIFNVNIGVILGVLSVYILMCRYGILGASVSSIVVAIALNLYSVEMLEFSGMLIIASFLAGAFSPLRKFGQLAAFIMVSTFCMLLLGAPVMLTYRLIDIFLATAVFVLIPERLMMLIDVKSQSVSPTVSSRLMQSNVSAKLSYASDTIKDLQQELETISAKFSGIDYNNVSTIYDAAANSVCRGCSCALDCWEENYNETVQAFHPVTERLKINGAVEPESMPRYFANKCCKLDKLVAAVNEYYSAFLSRQSNKRQVNEARKMVFEQFNSLADMLCEVSEEFGEISSYDESISRNVTTAFSKLEGVPLQVISSVDRFGRTTVEIYTDNMVKMSPVVLCETVSTAADKLFDLPSITTACGKTKLSFFEKASYTVDFSGQQSCFSDNTICGDSYEYFIDAKGYAYLLLSDGMGNGKRAAIDSVMTCSIMSKLIKAGFGIESAIKLINSSLLVKSTDESLSTIDMAKIDLYTGKTEFLKAGAATSFVDISGDVKRIDSTALPIGIIQPVECDRRLVTLRDNDVLVLVSDGATTAGEGWIVDEIKRNSHKSAKEISVKLTFEAKQRATEHQDDITVLVAKLQRGV